MQSIYDNYDNKLCSMCNVIIKFKLFKLKYLYLLLRKHNNPDFNVLLYTYMFNSISFDENFFKRIANPFDPRWDDAMEQMLKVWDIKVLNWIKDCV